MRIRSVRRRGIAISALWLAVLLTPRTAAAAAFGPQGVVRQFCEADGNGQRTTISGWAALAPLLMSIYEPAWDTITLVTGYTLGSPQAASDNTLAVEVRYTVVGQLTPLGLNPEPHVEAVTYRVQPDEQASWHILAPLPPPHVFANRVDIDTVRRSLANGNVNFLANSVFVWRMFQSAGWKVPFESTADLLSGATYHPVDDPKPGDLVVYLRDGAPYHVGLLEAKNQVVSSTLNAGITRTTVDAFAGEVRYLHLGPLETAPAASVPGSPSANAAAAPPTAAPQTTRPPAAARKKRTPAPHAKRRHRAKPSTRKHAKPKHPQPTPAAPASR